VPTTLLASADEVIE